MTPTDVKLCFSYHNQGDSGVHVSLLIALNERNVKQRDHIQPIIWQEMNISHHEKRSKIAFLTLINVRAVSAVCELPVKHSLGLHELYDILSGFAVVFMWLTALQFLHIFLCHLDSTRLGFAFSQSGHLMINRREKNELPSTDLRAWSMSTWFWLLVIRTWWIRQGVKWIFKLSRLCEKTFKEWQCQLNKESKETFS